MEEQFTIRLNKMQKLSELGITMYPYSYPRTHTFRQIKEKYQNHSAADLEKIDEVFQVCGRIMAIRQMGKSAFLHLLDVDEKMQIYIRKEFLTDKEFEVYKLLDIGDIIGVKGKIFRTHSQELTILVNELTFLAKSFHPLPEKWHGLRDKELRFRQRYLDLIVNDNTKRIFFLRSLIIQHIRNFFFDRGYLEVETPMMQPLAGGATARPFVTHHNALNIDLYLRVAPELYLKRLLVGGMEKIFEINRNFRNEGISQMHNPEFTMIEFYELYQDYNYYMTFTEDLISMLNEKILGQTTVTLNDKEISLKPPFPRKKFMELVAENAGVSVDSLRDENKLRQFIKTNLTGEEMPPTYGKMLELVFDHYAEPTLQQPTFVTEYPKAISPLSKRSRENDYDTERFELFITGMEIANGFSELNDPIDQRQRFEAQLTDREKGDDEAQLLDEDFLTALEHGMPPAAGEGIGIDRLVMIYTGLLSIREIILFPLLKPK